MKNILLLSALLIFISCEKENPTPDLSRRTATYAMQNLVFNSGFEINGQSSFAGWQYVNGLCCLNPFSTDVPPGGGLYSLKLVPVWLPGEGAAETYITGLNCTKTFQLKFFAKTTNVNQLSYASLYIKSNPASPLITQTVNSSSWQGYILNSAVITVHPADTLVVKLSAGSTEVAAWETFFDKVELYKIP
jgi:hypothetical protein